jgi:hypothetical protein
MTGRHAAMLAALLREKTVDPNVVTTDPAEFLHACDEDDLNGLIYEALGAQPVASDWVRTVRASLAADLRVHAVEELLRRRELVSVLDLLAAEGLRPILFKGVALAYSLYPMAAARRCRDTDLLFRREDAAAIHRILMRHGYTAPPWSDGELLFGQFPLKKTDAFGLVHTLDCHWRISTQSLFADVLTFDEAEAAATALPALGAGARAVGPLHALLLACIHPVMHHRNAPSLVWTYDIHLVASRLSAPQFDRFAELASAKRVAAICAYQLRHAARTMGTQIPEAALRRLDTAGSREPSVVYLRPNRGWGREFVSNLQGLSSWTARMRLLREVAFPRPAYMKQTYGIRPSGSGDVLLPLLYVHRLAAGSWKVIVGRK